MSRSPECPFCGAPGAERVAQWGGQIITSQWRCAACGSYFEALREDLDEAPVRGVSPDPSGSCRGARRELRDDF